MDAAAGIAPAPLARESTAVSTRTRTALSQAQHPSEQMGSRGAGVTRFQF